jgi:hypothetical protein
LAGPLRFIALREDDLSFSSPAIPRNNHDGIHLGSVDRYNSVVSNCHATVRIDLVRENHSLVDGLL